MENSTNWLLYLGVKHTLGIWKNRLMHREFMIWLGKNNWPKVCWICDGHVTHKERSLDHLIPASLCLELEMPMLLFDHRNFALAHAKCNLKRGNSIHLLPDSVKRILQDKSSVA